MGERGFISNNAEIQVETPIPKPPTGLSKVAKKEWKRVSADLHRFGLLTTIDRTILELYCATYARWIMAEEAITERGLTVLTENGYPVQRPEVAIAAKCSEQMRALCKELGMTPNARGRMVIKREEKEDELDEFNRKTRGTKRKEIEE